MFHSTSRAAKKLKFSSEATFSTNKAQLIALLESYTAEKETDLTTFFNTEIAPFKGVTLEGRHPVSYYDAIMCSAVIACAYSDNLEAFDCLKSLEPNLREYAQTVKTKAERITVEAEIYPFSLTGPIYLDGGYCEEYKRLVHRAEFNPSDYASEQFATNFDEFLAQPMSAYGRT